jgi:ankyrin repeat protein
MPERAIPFGNPEPEDGPLDERDAYGQTKLHKAAFDGAMDDVFNLLLKGANTNAVDRNGWTPFHCAASQGQIEIMLMLLRQSNINLSIVCYNNKSYLIVQSSQLMVFFF